MKLNDKHLTAFANGTAPIDKEGMLYKRGEVNKAFQKRWFILKGNILYYFDKKGDREPIGLVILEGCTVELSESSDAYTFELVFQGSGSRTYVLGADTQKELEDWMKAIACAGYDYMKLMVMELQRQLDDLTMDKTPVAMSNQQSDSAGSSSASEGLLVDLTVPGSASPVQMRKQSARRNPFNAGIDPLGAASNKMSKSMGSTGDKPRTFREMHRDFGIYITEKLIEGQANSELLEF